MVKDLGSGQQAVQGSKDTERPKRYLWKHLDYPLFALTIAIQVLYFPCK